MHTRLLCTWEHLTCHTICVWRATTNWDTSTSHVGTSAQCAGQGIWLVQAGWALWQWQPPTRRRRRQLAMMKQAGAIPSRRALTGVVLKAVQDLRREMEGEGGASWTLTSPGTWRAVLDACSKRSALLPCLPFHPTCLPGCGVALSRITRGPYCEVHSSRSRHAPVDGPLHGLRGSWRLPERVADFGDDLAKGVCRSAGGSQRRLS